MLISKLPFTFHTTNAMVIIRPIRASQITGGFKVTMAGTAALLATTVPQSLIQT